MQLLEDLLSVCISSAKAEKLELVENNKSFYTRSQIHVLLLKPFGTGKTTTLVKIPDSEDLISTTAPGVVGSINERGEYIEGSAVQAAGRVLVIDEFQNLSREARNAMLNLLDHQFYNKSLGYKFTEKNKIVSRRKFSRVWVKGNKIHIESRFSCVCGGTYVRRERMNDKAWLSRFVPVSVKFTLDDIYKLLKGELEIKLKMEDYTEPPVFEDYLKFVDEHKNICTSLPFVKSISRSDDFGYISRNAIDMARVAAFYSRNRGSVDDWEKILRFVPITLYNYMTSTLTLDEYNILGIVHDDPKTTNRDIAKNLGLSEQFVSTAIKVLRSKGLIWAGDVIELGL